LGAWGGFRLNVTQSYPVGLWQIEALQRQPAVGDIIFICPPAVPAFRLAQSRGYLPRGLCPGGSGPMIKSVAALAGQQIEITGHVRIDDRFLDHSEVLRADAKGRKLPIFGGGAVPVGHVFLHSKSRGSYDSRYFGPLPVDGILGLARPVFTVGR
jgi:conjugative transfer signal peptidase TraF